MHCPLIRGETKELIVKSSSIIIDSNYQNDGYKKCKFQINDNNIFGKTAQLKSSIKEVCMLHQISFEKKGFKVFEIFSK